MLCSKCNRLIKEGETVCPNCNTNVADMEPRCPNCWARIDKQDIRCRKCGCDIEKRYEELLEAERKSRETLMDKVKKIPLWIRICVPLLIILTLSLSYAGVKVYQYNVIAEKNARAVELAENYVVSVEIAVDNISKLAQVYDDMVYGQSWLDHTGSAEAVRDVYKDDITVIKMAKEPLLYEKKQIEQCDNEEISRAVEQVYYNYSRCYGFVIGENGQYPTYLDEFKKILDDYKSSLEELKQVIAENK